MTKHLHDFGEGDAVPIGEGELVHDELGAASPGEDCREALLARFLSQSEGFASAARSLGGSFARTPSLKGVKRS